MPADSISLLNAKPDKLFYFVANVVVFRESDGRCLILKRDMREKVHPGKYAVPGGKLEWNDLPINKPTRINGEVLDYENAVEDLLVRETKEEAGLEIYPELKYVNRVAFIRPDGIPVILVKYAARYKSGEVKPEQGGFTDFAWVNSSEVQNYDCIEGIKEEVSKTIKLFSESPFSKAQNDVDVWTSQFTPQYWPIFEQLAHLVEEVGETSRELNHAFGTKKKKPEEAEKNLSKELVDCIFTIVCIANTLKVDLGKEWDEMMQVRRYGRDNNRFDKKEEKQTFIVPSNN